MDWNFIICAAGLIIIAVAITITLNKVEENNKKYF